MKKTVYLDTTIPSYIFDNRDEIRLFIDITNKWWKEERLTSCSPGIVTTWQMPIKEITYDSLIQNWGCSYQK